MGAPEREAGGGAPSQGPGNPVVGAAQCGRCCGRPSPLSWAPGSSHRPTDHHTAHRGAWTGRVGLYLGVRTLRRWLSEGPGVGPVQGGDTPMQLLLRTGWFTRRRHRSLTPVPGKTGWPGPRSPWGPSSLLARGHAPLEPLVTPHTGGRTERGWAGAEAGPRPAASCKPVGDPRLLDLFSATTNPTNLSFVWPPSPSPAGTADLVPPTRGKKLPRRVIFLDYKGCGQSVIGSRRSGRTACW